MINSSLKIARMNYINLAIPREEQFLLYSACSCLQNEPQQSFFQSAVRENRWNEE
jgi:hypothetical protein